MAELLLITATALGASNILKGHGLCILNQMKKRRANAIPTDFIAKHQWARS